MPGAIPLKMQYHKVEKIETNLKITKITYKGARAGAGRPVSQVRVQCHCEVHIMGNGHTPPAQTDIHL